MLSWWLSTPWHPLNDGAGTSPTTRDTLVKRHSSLPRPSHRSVICTPTGFSKPLFFLFRTKCLPTPFLCNHITDFFSAGGELGDEQVPGSTEQVQQYQVHGDQQHSRAQKRQISPVETSELDGNRDTILYSRETVLCGQSSSEITRTKKKMRCN